MSEVVADNCALVHAQQMGVLAVPPMPLVEALLTTGALRLVTTKAVRGELSQGLEAVVSAWQEAGPGWVRSPFGEELEGIVDVRDWGLVA